MGILKSFQSYLTLLFRKSFLVSHTCAYLQGLKLSLSSQIALLTDGSKGPSQSQKAGQQINFSPYLK